MWKTILTNVCKHLDLFGFKINFKPGKTEAIDVPVPALESGHLLIRTNRTLISPGTERMLLQFGRAGLIGKARQQPEKVKEAINKIRTDGIGATAEAISSKLDKPMPLGYCNVGRVVEVGSGVEKFSVGDRVVSNGPHAEYFITSKASAKSMINNE